MNDLLKSAISRFKTKDRALIISTHKTSTTAENYLVPIMKRQWETHCKHPNAVVFTLFNVKGGGCQLLSNTKDQLVLNIALDQPDDYEALCRFKRFRFYNLFYNDRNIYLLEFGGLTDAAMQITSEVLAEVFGVSIYEEIEIAEFKTYIPSSDYVMTKI